MIALAGIARATTPVTPGPTPIVLVVDDEARVRRADQMVAWAHGHVVPDSRDDITLVSMRGETVAFQVVVVAGDQALDRTPLTMGALAPADGTAPGSRLVHPEIFREHYLHVDRRSRNERRPDESLGWEPGARPADDDMLGDVPDALLPAADDVAPLTPRPAVPANQTGAFWVDLFVPETLAPEDYAALATVTADGQTLARFTVKLTVRAPVLPYRATGAFAFYEPAKAPVAR